MEADDPAAALADAARSRTEARDAEYASLMIGRDYYDAPSARQQAFGSLRLGFVSSLATRAMRASARFSRHRALHTRRPADTAPQSLEVPGATGDKRVITELRIVGDREHTEASLDSIHAAMHMLLGVGAGVLCRRDKPLFAGKPLTTDFAAYPITLAKDGGGRTGWTYKSDDHCEAMGKWLTHASDAVALQSMDWFIDKCLLSVQDDADAYVQLEHDGQFVYAEVVAAGATHRVTIESLTADEENIGQLFTTVIDEAEAAEAEKKRSKGWTDKQRAKWRADYDEKHRGAWVGARVAAMRKVYKLFMEAVRSCQEVARQTARGPDGSAMCTVEMVNSAERCRRTDAFRGDFVLCCHNSSTTVDKNDAAM